ncbi:maleylpyruvate isomerase N-terminal domain-containing protein [Streptomyces sp. NPDC059459]|uniref:maleylpyruvate isomerase N-terminal domain-containing protein n=1 Tax=Streptomyces sp. NPDC059459 TaxID=3346839 RepID=UPI0036D18E13
MLTSAAALTDGQVRAPSRLPRWSRGPVLTHLARSAGSRTRLLTAARTGADLPQDRDEAERESEITEGAGRPAAVLAQDLHSALHRSLAAAHSHPQDARDVPVRWLGAGLRPERGAVSSMLREVHHTDLAAGHEPAHWPAPFVQREPSTVAAALNDRGDAPALVLLADEDRVPRPIGDRAGPQASGPAAHLLGRLTGRTDGRTLTVGPPGPLVPVPARLK